MLDGITIMKSALCAALLFLSVLLVWDVRYPCAMVITRH